MALPCQKKMALKFLDHHGYLRNKEHANWDDLKLISSKSQPKTITKIEREKKVKDSILTL